MLFPRTAICAVALLLCAFFMTHLWAQHPAMANLTVSVTDITSAVIPGATVRALSGQQEIAAEKSGQNGQAVLRLARGLYEIRADAQGFRSETIQLDISDDSPVSHVFRLQVGSCSPCVVVENPAERLALWTPPLDDVWVPVESMVFLPLPVRSRGHFKRARAHPN